MDQPNTRRSNPHENRSQFNSGSSAQATEETILRWPWRLVRGNRATRCPFKSKSRICRLSWGMAIIPPVETARRLTDESVRMVDKEERMFRNSQTLIVRSSDPETTLSSRAKTLDVTVSVCPWKTETAGIGSRKSHKRKVVSREAVTTRRCVGCAETCVSSWSWPVSGCNGWAVSTSHSIAVRSQLPVIIWSMLDNQSAATMTERWPPGPENSQRGVRSVSTRSRSSNWPSLSSNSSSDECPFLQDNNKVTRFSTEQMIKFPTWEPPSWLLPARCEQFHHRCRSTRDPYVDGTWWSSLSPRVLGTATGSGHSLCPKCRQCDPPMLCQ